MGFCQSKCYGASRQQEEDEPMDVIVSLENGSDGDLIVEDVQLMSNLSATVEYTEEASRQLIVAVKCKQLEAVKECLEKGADPNTVNEYDLLERSALHIASEGGSEPIVRVLIESGAEVNKEDQIQQTALHRAVRVPNNINVVRLLLESGAEVNKEDRYQRAALHEAVQVRHDSNVVRLLVENGADPFKRDRMGRTPLHHARTPDNAMALLDSAGPGEKGDMLLMCI